MFFHLVGFTLAPYAGADDATKASQIPMVMDGRNVEEGVKTMMGNGPIEKPAYLAMYNEPNYSFMGYTKLTDAVTACEEAAPLFAPETLAAKGNTKYIAPVPALPMDQWLKDFFATCPQYLEHIDIMSLHIYTDSTQHVIDEVSKLHSTYGKPVWITEIAPPAPAENCKWNAQQVKEFMQETITRLRAEAPYVEKYFWNCGEAGGAHTGLGDGGCNPSLTNNDGSLTELGEFYASVQC